MSFQTDQQTLDDLNIFGRPGQKSIFEIFNKTKTRGGGAVTEEMFRSPLTDVQKINSRAAIIQYLQLSGGDFPISLDHFDPIESYIRMKDERTKLSAKEDSLTSRINNLVALDSDTALIHQGIAALIKLLGQLRDFLKLQQMVFEHPFADRFSVIANILNDPDFFTILQSHSGRSPSAREFIAYDEFFRFLHREEVFLVLDFVYQLDAYFAIAKVARERKFVFANALPMERRVLDVQGFFHPHIDRAVANSIGMRSDLNVVFLTGANMAGKSTFMKSFSIALFLAHMGFPVPAEKMEFSVLDGMYTTINLPDNLGMGASHFYAEVLRVKKIAAELKSGKNLFVLFDEMFRGTNVKDACEATIAFTQAFSLKRNSMFVISTHIIEAGEVLMERCNGINFIYLPTSMQENMPSYSYKIQQGLTADRHGLLIIMNEGILEILESGLEQNKQG